MKENGKTNKFTAKELEPSILALLRKQVKSLNEQFPIRIDESTTMYMAVINGTAINYCYRVDFNKSDFTEEEINELMKSIKETTIENLKFLFQSGSDKMSPSEWKRLFTELGIYYVYTYMDCNNKAFARFTVYPKEIDLKN